MISLQYNRKRFWLHFRIISRWYPCWIGTQHICDCQIYYINVCRIYSYATGIHRPVIKHVVLPSHEVCANILHVGALLLIYINTLRAICTIRFLFYCIYRATDSSWVRVSSASWMRRKIPTWETTMELICTPWFSYARIFLHLRHVSYLNAILF